MDEPVHHRDKFDLDFSSLHERVEPANVRPSDRILARIRLRLEGSSGKYHRLRVWKMSPLGVELVAEDSDLKVSKGDPIDLEITIGGQRMNFEGLVVDLIEENDLIKLVGVRLSNRLESSHLEEKRGSPRWICSDEFFPTCIASSPAVVNDYMHFQVRDVSASGLQLICSLRNKFLIPDMTLRITANFPLVGDFVATIRIVRVGFTTARGQDRLAVGVEFLEITEHMRNVLGQYLIQFGNVDSLDNLRSLGFKPSSITKAVDFYYLKSEADYNAVLDLRYRAHKSDGNFGQEQISVQDMGDLSDSQARIVVGKYRDQVVATARVRFNTLDEPMEHEKYVVWPDTLPRRDRIMEISRVCTHPQFRRGDLLAGLFQFTCATVLHPERPWIVIGSWPEMLGFYKKLGFQETGLVHREPKWKEEQHLLIGNSNHTVTGRGVHPLYWNLIWRSSSEHAVANSLVTLNGMDRIRLIVYKLLGPVVKLVFRFRRRPQRSKSG